jgi:ribosomal protein S12 methylthiotransferase accessory factor
MTLLGTSSLRSRPPSETLALATRLMPALGISRVTDITRMDRLGLPVFASIRPRGIALCVNAGKGMSRLDAHVGAVMEAVEFAAAEPARSLWQGRPWRMAELEAEWAGELHLSGLAPRIGPLPAPGQIVEAVRCEDVAGGRAMWLPAELIFMPFGDDESQLICGWSSNGLASGNSVDEATLHAVFEVLERDALAMHTVHDDSLWLPPACLPEPFGSVVEGWRRMGIELSARLVPNTFGLPCFRALLHECGDAVIGLAEGSGLHFDAGIALARAICEAAQARLSHIHGGRDDITRFYAANEDDRTKPPPAHETLAYREAFETTRRTTWDEVPSLPCRGLALDVLLVRLIDRLRELGFKQVLRHRFDLDLGGLQAVKVVVPGCEVIDRRLERMGPRLRERVRALDA